MTSTDDSKGTFDQDLFFQTSLHLSHLERVRQPLLPVPHTGFLKHPSE
jgi:hypothetical protein